MLKTCPECELQVSDKALSCPHCGYPFAKNISPPRSKRKHLRLPNGFGQISKIEGRKLRNPYRAMVTVGKEADGKLIVKPLKPKAYFPTYNEAYKALVEYHKNPYDFSNSITMQELYERWSAEAFPKYKNVSSVRNMKNAWRYCSGIYNMDVKEIRRSHIRECVENSSIKLEDGNIKEPPPSVKGQIRDLLSNLLSYAVEYEMVETNCAKTYSVSREVRTVAAKNHKGHISFTDDEMHTLWENISLPYVDMILIQCYSGWRPRELCELMIEGTNISDWTFVGGRKTEAGESRLVPIHTRIRPLVLAQYTRAQEIGSKYLFNQPRKSAPVSYSLYSRHFAAIRDHFNFNPAHRPHDGRVQFVTQAKKYKVDEYAIKYMVGHSIQDLTERVYTKRDTAWLREEIEKIR